MTFLTDVFSQGFGPISVTPLGGGFTAQLDGRQVSLTEERGAIRLVTAVDEPWPAAPDAGARIQRMLDDVSASRGDLTWFTADAASRVVRVEAWLPADGIGAYDIAVGVRTAVLLAGVAQAAVVELGRRLHVEVELARMDEVLSASAPAAGSTAGGAAASEPGWGHVEQRTGLHALDGGGAVIAQLEPGTWYRTGESAGGWIRVTLPDTGADGWADSAAVKLRT